MTGALLLIGTKVGKEKKVRDKIREMDNVKIAKMLTGAYDVMAIIEKEEIDEIIGITVEKIRTIDGVIDTVTHVFIEEE